MCHISWKINLCLSITIRDVSLSQYPHHRTAQQWEMRSRYIIVLPVLDTFSQSLPHSSYFYYTLRSSFFLYYTLRCSFFLFLSLLYSTLFFLPPCFCICFLPLHFCLSLFSLASYFHSSTIQPFSFLSSISSPFSIPSLLQLPPWFPPFPFSSQLIYSILLSLSIHIISYHIITCIIGALAHDPRHSTSLSVNIPSAVVSPSYQCVST